jgi:hypothetical protein
MTTIQAFGDDIELAPKKGYLSGRRGKQFAMIQPSAAGRIDLGLVLPGVPPGARLESAKGFNAFVHPSSPAHQHRRYRPTTDRLAPARL